jgi:hypothetical protein
MKFTVSALSWFILLSSGPVFTGVQVFSATENFTKIANFDENIGKAGTKL